MQTSSSRPPENTSGSSGPTHHARPSRSSAPPIRHSEPTSPGGGRKPAYPATWPPRHPESPMPHRLFWRASSPRLPQATQEASIARASLSSSPVPLREPVFTTPSMAASPPRATALSIPIPYRLPTAPQHRHEPSAQRPSGADSCHHLPPPGPISFPRGSSRSRETPAGFRPPGREPQPITKWTPRFSMRATTGPWG